MVALVLAGACAAPPAAAAADLTVLSGGAIETGLRRATASFEQQRGRSVELRFATAPEIRRRLLAGETVDLVIAPPAVLDELTGAGRLPAGAERRAVGSVAIGVAVRADRPAPDVSSIEALTRGLRAADELVYNRASTGMEVERRLEREGLATELAARTTRYPDGASVMRHVLAADGNAIGLGAVTEILPFAASGLRYAGPLPDAWQVRTRYVAVRTVPSGVAVSPGTVAAEFLDHLASPAARDAMGGAGVEPPP